jgi:hypothetical protein
MPLDWTRLSSKRGGDAVRSLPRPHRSAKKIPHAPSKSAMQSDLLAQHNDLIGFQTPNHSTPEQAMEVTNTCFSVPARLELA